MGGSSGSDEQASGATTPPRSRRLRRDERIIDEYLRAIDPRGAAPQGAELAALERQFVRVAAEFARRTGIDAADWRRAGVPAEVLRRAGIPDSDTASHPAAPPRRVHDYRRLN